MPRDVPVNFAKSSSEVRSAPTSAQRLINLYAEKNPDDAKTPVTLYGTPGLFDFTSVGIGPFWGAQEMGGLLYVVSGKEVYLVNSDGSYELLGGMVALTSPVRMVNNGTQLVIVTQADHSYLATSSSLDEITDDDFQTASDVELFDNYFIFTKKGSNESFFSALGDGAAYDALDRFTVEASPSNLKGLRRLKNELWFFGSKVIDVFYDSGNIDLPFERIPNALIERGTVSTQSIVLEDDTLFFLGDDKIVYRVQGYTPLRVSTHAVEESLRSFITVDDVYAYSYTEAGHKHIIYTFPTGGVTWVLDLATGLWHERESSGTVWRASCLANCFGKNLVGDNQSNNIYELSLDYYDENTLRPIVRTAIGAPVFDSNKRMIFDRLALGIETGVGLAMGQGSDPQVMMQFSVDGGRNYSDEQWTSFGEVGDFQARAEWRNQGQARNMVYKIQISDPVKVAISGAWIDLRECGS